MFDGIVTRENVISLTEPHYVDISRAFKIGFRTYAKIKDKYYQNMYTPVRFKTDIIRTKVLGILLKKFKQKYPSNNVKIIANFKKDLIALAVKDLFSLRIKKIDGALKPKFNKTKESKDFILQQHALFPNIATLVLGYMPDPTWSSFSLYIIHPQQKWASFKITEQMIQEQAAKESARVLTLQKDRVLPNQTIIKTKIDKKQKRYGTE